MFRYFVRMAALIAAIAMFWYLTKQGSAIFSERIFWVERHGINIAYLGTFFSFLSVAYMLRKYRITNYGKLRNWLDLHVVFGTLGLFLLLLHSQYEFEVLIPTYTVWAMMTIGISGLFGWHVYLTKARTLLDDVAALAEKDEIILSTMTSSAFRFWHDIHFIFSLAAGVLTIVHIASIFIYRGRF